MRRSFLKWVYPIFRLLSGRGRNGLILHNKAGIAPASSFYGLGLTDNNGLPLPFSTLRGKSVLIVNTASDCGFTPQYSELQKLYETNTDKLMIIGFPSNDFKEQEQGTDEEIAAFCQVNYGVTFPLAAKSVVIPGQQQHPVYQWLTQAQNNGWNNHPPDWNFSKYLISPNGTLTHYFGPAIPPAEIEKHLQKPRG